jgi:hypothetical protein
MVRWPFHTEYVGHKQLSLENWTQPDPTSTIFVRAALGQIIEMDGQDWARHFLAEELKPHVPQQVRELFDVARGTMLYGWLFYPLFRLGEEQLYRVLEAAAKTCYRDLGGPKSPVSFAHAVDALIERGVIRGDERLYWDAAREIRNIGSTPSPVQSFHRGRPSRALARPPTTSISSSRGRNGCRVRPGAADAWSRHEDRRELRFPTGPAKERSLHLRRNVA